MKNCENQTDHAVISGGFEYFLVAQQKSSKIFLQHIIPYKISALFFCKKQSFWINKNPTKSKWFTLLPSLKLTAKARKNELRVAIVSEIGANSAAIRCRVSDSSVSKKSHYGSTGTVYFPTWKVDIYDMVNVEKYTSPMAYMVPYGSCKQMALFFRCRVASAPRNDLLLLRHALPWNAVGGRSQLDGGGWWTPCP